MKQSISFDRIADRYDETRGGERRGQLLAAEFEPYVASAHRLLEIGVGTGIVAAALGRLGHTVVGIDISGEMLSRAHDRVGARVARADAHALPFPAASLAGAYVVWVLHLVADPAAVLRECARVLEPAARLVVVAGHPRTKDAEDMTEYDDALDVMREGRRDTAEAIQQWAADAGLERICYRELEDRHQQAPGRYADVLEKRTFSFTWDLDERTWNDVVQPIIDGLRALPDTTRSRVVVRHRDLLVFESER
jgi:ubiquinone/menaquinone biosynthesis C-methylase UbiE